MDGSRHEKATLVGLAYGIGLLTGFIWLGINQVNIGNLNIDNFQSASVIESTTDTSAVAPVVAPAKVSSLVSYENGLLQFAALDGDRLLSYNPDVSGNPASAEFADQGYHYGNIAFVVSPSQEYVFFCERKTVEAETCRPFVYDALTDAIYPVRKNGSLVDLLTSAASIVNWNGSVLTIGNDLSINSAKPWLLGS